MTFYAFHGDDKKEQELGQRYEVDIDLSIETCKAIEQDDLMYTVNYKEVFNLVEKIVTDRQFRLLETLVETIAQSCIEKFKVEDVTVKVRKLKPPIKGILDYMEVEAFRDRVNT